MSKFATIAICVIAAWTLPITYADVWVVTPPDCAVAGPGSSVGIATIVTNVTEVKHQLLPLEPYNLTAAAVYNVTFTFVPTQNTSVASFNVVATFDVAGVPTNVTIATTNVGPYTETLLGSVWNLLNLVTQLNLLVACLVNLPALLALNFQQLLDCAGAVLVNSVLAQIPAQGTATILLPVPANALTPKALFTGIVLDNNGDLLACKQGNVNILT